MNRAGSSGRRRRVALGIAILSITTVTLGACGGGGGGGDTSKFAGEGRYLADTINCESRDVPDREKKDCTEVVDCLWSNAPDGERAISLEQWVQIETSIWGPQKYGTAQMNLTRHADLTAAEAASLKNCDVSLEGASES